jgi:Tol biopolymer transport system component
MALTLGTKLGPYEIASPLGAGGMGEVYRARDTKLKREVALKVLPELFANDAQRMARFEREAQVLASLNHPNIAHIHGLEESNEVRALVMELVEGQTLAERIAHGPMPLEEAVPLAKQIAEALEYAHDKGIIHRDLKPANIKLTPDGQVKVLDFGLAKALDVDSGEVNISTSPTISAAATRAGVLLGTAAYMSPEQAKGKAADRRTDIWAFGCVLYDMLTGKPAFDGETITDTLAAVVRAEPEWKQLPDKVPSGIRELLHRCLTKDAKQRLQAIGEARIAIDKYLADPSADSATEGLASTLVQDMQRLRSRQRFLALAAVAALVAAIFLGVLHWGRAPEKVRVVRSYIRAMPNSSFLLTGQQSGFALSTDGLRLAYVAQGANGKFLLWVRPLDSLTAQPLAGTEDAGYPFWSPDGRSIGFFGLGKLKRIDASGGPPLTLADAPLPRGGSWSKDGVIVFAPSVNAPLYRVSSAGGTATPLTSLDPSKNETTHRWPHFLPDGRHFLYVAGTPLTPKETITNSIRVGSLDSTESKVLLQSHADGLYASGHILFLRLNTLMAQPFDLKRLELTDDAFPIADPVQEDEIMIRSVFSASQNGFLAYLGGTGGANRELVWLDRSGKKVGQVPGLDGYSGPRISPDGKRLAFTISSPSQDIWTYDIARGVKTRLTFGSAAGQGNTGSVWSPDGQRVAYTSVRAGKFGIYQKLADGSGSEELLFEETGAVKYLNDWSPDAKLLAYQQATQGVNGIWMLALSAERKSFPFLQSQFTAFLAAFSADGKWLAYCSSESGEQRVYVVPFPGPGGKWQVSPAGGCYPRWRHDQKELFYLSADNKIMAAVVNGSGSSFAIGAITTLFETPLFRSQMGAFDVTADGQRFIVSREPGQPNAAITLVENWDAELKKK